VLSFYHQPKSVDDVLRQLCGKILDQFGVENETFARWTG
jgi:4-hydroxy-3-polyprenylbenzoate decarboxylase